MNRHLFKALTLFCVGGLLYFLIEILWRGYSYPAMVLIAGLSFLLIGSVNEEFPWDMPLVLQALIAAVYVLIIEFMSGVVLNLVFQLNLWDYSSLPFNLLGQVCAQFVVAWYFLAFPAIFLDDFLRWKLFGEDKPRYKVF